MTPRTSALLRRLSLLFTLGCGLLALIWGLSHLQSIFIEERDDTLASIATRKNALEQYAHKELEQELTRQLDQAGRSIRQALDDPLLPASHLLLIDGGEQRLPRLDEPHGGANAPAKSLFERLVGRYGSAVSPPSSVDDDSPLQTRLWLFDRFIVALRTHHRAGIERSVRALLGHRASFILTASDDIAIALAMLELLSSHSTPSQPLMRGLVREGLPYGGGPGRPQATMAGLERQLLRQRSRLSAPDFGFLRDRLVAIARRHNVLWTDFADQAAEGAAQPIEVDPDLSEPALIESGSWYVAPAGGGRIRGVAVDTTRVLAEVTTRMKERGLLEPADRVVAAVQPVQALSELDVTTRSPRWELARSKADGRYQLKTALGVASGLLSMGILVLGWMVYRRRHRFLELKGSFVSAVSHELRTPLASIRLMAETLERRTREVPGARDYPTRIIRDVDELSLLVENILSFDRLSRGRWTAKLTTMRLGDIVDKIASDLPSTCRRPVELETAGLEEAELSADTDLIGLLLANLVKNACHYNKREPVELRIAARPGPHGGLLVTVADNGVGIPPGEQDKIFGDFYRASPRTEQAVRGSGLGLAICRKIMDAHHGSIRVAQSSEQGTTFEMHFPPLSPARSA